MRSLITVLVLLAFSGGCHAAERWAPVIWVPSFGCGGTPAQISCEPLFESTFKVE